MTHLLSIATVQEILSVSRSTVDRMRDRGQLRSIHIGRAVRIPREDVERLLMSLTA